MEIESGMIAADRDQLFADWGVEVVLRAVEQAYDPEDGAIEETPTDFVVTAVTGGAAKQAARGTAGQHGKIDAVFLIRGEDVPEGVELRTRRVVQGGVEYRVMSTETDAAEAIVTLHCRLI